MCKEVNRKKSYARKGWQYAYDDFRDCDLTVLGDFGVGVSKQRLIALIVLLFRQRPPDCLIPNFQAEQCVFVCQANEVEVNTADDVLNYTPGNRFVRKFCAIERWR